MVNSKSKALQIGLLRARIKRYFYIRYCRNWQIFTKKYNENIPKASDSKANTKKKNAILCCASQENDKNIVPCFPYPGSTGSEFLFLFFLHCVCCWFFGFVCHFQFCSSRTKGLECFLVLVMFGFSFTYPDSQREPARDRNRNRSKHVTETRPPSSRNRNRNRNPEANLAQSGTGPSAGQLFCNLLVPRSTHFSACTGFWV